MLTVVCVKPPITAVSPSATSTSLSTLLLREHGADVVRLELHVGVLDVDPHLHLRLSVICGVTVRMTPVCWI